MRNGKLWDISGGVVKPLSVEDASFSFIGPLWYHRQVYIFRVEFEFSLNVISFFPPIFAEAVYRSGVEICFFSRFCFCSPGICESLVQSVRLSLKLCSWDQGIDKFDRWSGLLADWFVSLSLGC